MILGVKSPSPIARLRHCGGHFIGSAAVKCGVWGVCGGGGGQKEAKRGREAVREREVGEEAEEEEVSRLSARRYLDYPVLDFGRVSPPPTPHPTPHTHNTHTLPLPFPPNPLSLLLTYTAVCVSWGMTAQ